MDAGVAEPPAADIDVAGLHQALPRPGAQGGADLRTSARLEAAEREGEGWQLSFGRAGEAARACWSTPAGAWADDVAALAGARPLGVAPYRRTVCQLRVDPPPPAALPLVLDLAGRFYFKPEQRQAVAQPARRDAERAVRRGARGARRGDRDRPLRTGRRLARRGRSSASGPGCAASPPTGCRSTATIAARAGFFWFAGQGGFGIQTAPAAARLAAQVLLGLPQGWHDRKDRPAV
jgi:D-arginine dehydrogenase